MSSYSSVIFQTSEEILDKVSPFVDLGIVVSRRYAVAFRRDDWRDVMCRQGISQAVCIERTVCQKVIGGQLFDQLWHAAQVVRLTRQ